MKLTLAYPDTAAQLPDAPLRIAREPPDAGQDGLVQGSRMFNRGRENRGEGRSPGCGVWLLNHLFKPHALHGTLNSCNWNRLVEQLRCRHAKQAGSSTGMQPRTCNAGPSSQSGYEGNGPGAEHHWGLIVDENDVDTRVGQHTVLIYARRSNDCLSPKAQEVNS